MNDLYFLNKINVELKRNIQQIPEIKWSNIGYVKNKRGKISGISLNDCKINELNRIIEPLENMKDLRILNLSFNNIEDISPLSELKNIYNLNLSFNNITDISPISSYRKLRNLVLSENKIANYDLIGKFGKLNNLYLSKNKVEDLSFISKLKDLRNLFLTNNNIKKLFPLNELHNIECLYLSRNEIENINPLTKLRKLQKLVLSKNDIFDISLLSEIDSLYELDLGDNYISDVNSLKSLTNITRLDLSSNMIKDVSVLKELKKLEYLDLNNNEIEDVSFIKYLSLISDIHLANNPLKIPPLEIASKGNDAIKNYFKQIVEQGTDYIYEAKLMIVGEPGAGKSSLLNKLFDENFAIPNYDLKSTLGIDVRQNWKFENEQKLEFKVNVWDFGGQHIQYMLHQFFLTSECLYVLMAEKRRELTNFDYWLNIIKILGKNSPVIILFNEINLNSASSFIFNEKKYRDLFPELNFLYKDINLSNIYDGRFENLINEIKSKIENLSFIGKEVPAKWVDVRKILEEIKWKKYIHIKEYFEICNQCGIYNEEDSILVLNTFHTLGIVLNFYEDTNLRDTIFLDHNWTIDAVYTVLTDNDENIRKKDGIFKKDEMFKIWSDKGYKNDEQIKLLQLMLKDNFELCYKVPENQDDYIVPLLLPRIKPNYEWDDKENLMFRFQYPFMPEGIISRLIVRLHENILNRLVWNEGVILSKNGAKAQIIETKTIKEGIKIIDIKISGNQNYRKELLTIIREEIRKIQKTSFPDLPYFEMVPCNCNKCKNSDIVEFYDYKVLEDFLNDKENTPYIQCRIGRKMVYIPTLIDAVYNNYEINENKIENLKAIEVSKNLYINKKLILFLASSSELDNDKKEFEIFINRENKRLIKQGVFIQLELCNDFIDAMSKTRLQDEYNKAIKESDIFISLFFTKVGKYTEEEFETAFGNFKKTGKPIVYTYFKNERIKMLDIKKENIDTKFKFEKKLEKLGHFKSTYDNIDSLLHQFKIQLDKILSDR